MVGGVGVGFLELPHLLPAPDALSGLGHLHDVVLVADLVLFFGAQLGQQLGEEVTCLLLAHLFEIGHPVFVHLVAPLL
jgi:hypothetical protein